MKKRSIIFLLLLTTAIPVFSQVLLNGVVKDSKGGPLLGVAVSIKGTSSGTLTDDQGKFSLKIPSGLLDSALTFTYIGYVSQKVRIADQRFFEVTLDEAFKELNEVVVIGYGTQKKVDLTGSVSQVEGSQLGKLTTVGLDQALQGLAAGVSVAQNSGAPGDDVQIRIRGTGSIFSNNDPLYVIDGIPTKDPQVLKTLPTDEIASISILKDAASSAIYGSRANNGVVLITTKKAQKGENRIKFSSQFGVQMHGPLIKMVNTPQYVEIYNEMVQNDNPIMPPIAKLPSISSEYAATLPDVNHLDEIFRTAPVQTYELSVAGGNGKTSYLLFGSYMDQQGIIYNSDYTRGTSRLSINSEVNRWLNVTGSLNVYHAVTDILATTGDGWGGNGSNPVRYAFFRSPAIATYDSTGNFVDLPQHPEFFGDGYNPLGVAKNTHNQKIENGYSCKFNSHIKLTPNLSFITNAGIDYNTFNRRNFNLMWGTGNRINNPNSLIVENYYTSTWTVNNVFNYSKNFPGKHTVNLMIGEESSKATTYDQSTTVQGFPDQSSNIVYLQNSIGKQTATENLSGSALQSFFGRLNYDYKGKYLLSLVLREDGTSRFSSQHTWGTFYSGSLGWIINKEKFLENVKSIDSWKLRVDYGSNGNQDIPLYAYTDQLSANYNYPFGGVVNNGYTPTALGNVNLKWETATQCDVGTDISLWNGMLTANIDYYYKVTHDMLVPQATPPSVGYATSPWINNGEVLNNGVEIEISYKRYFGDFSFSITPNIATVHNVVLQMNGAYVDNPFLFTKTEKGYPIGSFYMWKMDGIFQTQSDIFGHAYQGPVNTGSPGEIRPGDVKYVDVNGDGKIDEADRTHVGSPIPTLTGGLNMEGNYRNFDLSILFQGAYGDKIYFQAARDIEGFYRAFPVTERYYKDHWKGPGTSNTQPIASWADAQNNTATSTRFLEDGSYLRLKNVQLGYTFPKSLISAAHIEKLRVYVSGTNLWTLTKYTGLDPEMTTNNNAPAGTTDLVKNVDWGTFPSAMSLNFGIELTF